MKTLQEQLQTRVKEIITDFKKRYDTEDYFFIQQGIVWDYKRNSWVLLIYKQSRTTLDVERHTTCEVSL